MKDEGTPEEKSSSEFMNALKQLEQEMSPPVNSASMNMLMKPLEMIANADPTKVQEVVIAQLALMTAYHTIVLDQARRSFKWALIAAGVGFGFFVLAVVYVMMSQPGRDISIISLISGALIEVIAGINFYLYGKTAGQMAEFQSRLDSTQRFLLANSVCESLEGEAKAQARVSLSELLREVL